MPFLVRIAPLISFPAFVAIFVFEHRKGRAYAAAFLYFAAASVVLMLGSRGATFSLLLTLWYVARLKSTRRTRIVLLASFAILLMLAADIVRQNPEDAQPREFSFLPLEFLKMQGVSLDAVSVVVRYRGYFAPYAWQYPIYEIADAFVPIDTEHYQRGRILPYDLPVFLNVNAYNLGAGTGGS